MQEAAKGFQRLKACKQLPLLRAALAAQQSKHAGETALKRKRSSVALNVRP